jgi:riboflavin kinase/FMN adenylyltransferase
MEVIYGIENIKREENSILTMGTFDGVHLGHQAIIKEMNNRRGKHQKSTLVTFEPHPQDVIGKKEREIKLLTLLDEKIEILNLTGLDRLIVIPFAREFSLIEPEEFIEKILVSKIGMKEIIIGFNHAFGKNRRGGFELLKDLEDKFGYVVDMIKPVYFNGENISSTRIRSVIKDGNVELASSLLGRNYSLSGIVVKGDGRGKKLGFPTANIDISSQKKLIPSNGVYEVLVFHSKGKYKGAMNIGTRPTFGLTQKTIEVFILDFDKNIYGERLKVEFVRRIRDEQKFNSVDELIKQMEKDVGLIK